MTRNIYALLVGIDKYPDPISPLHGCVKDITAMKEYLENRVKKDKDHQLHLRTRTNDEAKRKTIIDDFREHLCKAQKDDIVLFYYSGHGSQERAPEEFRHLEPDRLNETLVCYDSRSQGEDCWDLADKELAQLIAEVSEKKPHICIILDSCHSGSGTRDPLQETGVRLTSIDERNRPLNSYLPELQQQIQNSLTSSSLKDNPSGWKILTGSHVLLAACRDSELAKEINGNGEQRGAFSYCLLETLKQANGNMSYQDLFREAKSLVSNKITDQSPQFEVNYSEAEDQVFLKGAIAERSHYFAVSYSQEHHSWVIDGGGVHGIQSPSGDEKTLLALFPSNSNAEDLHDPSQSVGDAAVTLVLPAISYIKDLDPDQKKTLQDSDKEKTFKAVIISLPLPPLAVYFEGEEDGVKLARQEMEPAGGLNNQSSAYVREEKELTLAHFRLLCRKNQYLIVRPQDDRPLVAQIDGYTQDNAKKAIQRLEHIARWNAIAQLGSSGNGVIKEGDIEMELIFGDKDLSPEETRLEYKLRDDGQRSPSTIQIKLTNNSNRALYCGLLILTDLFEVQFPFRQGMEAGYVKLEPQGTYESQSGRLTLPQELPQEITEFNNTIKLIVSTAEFDGRLLTQNKLDAPKTTKGERGADRGVINRNTLNCLMNKVQNRDWEDAEPQSYQDWFTKQVTITTVRPLNETPVSNTDSKNLGSGVKLQPHPSLKAKARLTTVPQASRGLEKVILPPILREDPQVTQAFQFTTSRGTDPGLSVLELTDVENREVVTEENPLRLLTDVPLGEGENLLAFAYDGEFYLPLGYGTTIENEDGKTQTEIKLERLSTPYSGDRDVVGSIWMCFVKVIGENLGRKFDGYHLRAVKVAEDQTVTPVENIKDQVKNANRILLYVHGILGDTKDMVKSVQRAKLSVDGQEHSLNDLYDLVLTFDYENINTDIPEIARILKKKLEDVGLRANHSKVLHIVAHSMGGLVSRWFIEREEGNQVVQHLVMLGTPNAGSPWSTVQDLATLALGIGLNSLSTVAWPVKVLGSLVSGIGVVDVTLDQMKPSSAFLRNLAASPDPGIPYSVIAGNTSIKRAAMEEEGGKASLLNRLIQNLGTQVVEFPFFGQPNDIAVKVDSIKNIPEGRMIPPNIQEVACDHLTYFVENSKALNHLSEYLTQNQ
ncbi:caspase family protein [Nostoc sp. FACHB-87]|uniref:caspase family protein n=1 Tax=Nostocaceae TaxID=1162 RepID=UPI00168527F5|nr:MULTISPECIES: caspase family protein [Nostocaceae]MBD2459277.1 caspase family protein [Nostoc sp. FACHB-87]MBD2480271.1 caspase family protein [Anabaena sp. FACHB-83]